uniref:Uncharacterized protein n=1 Tax=Lygus hesperus TaxID=30085 RepID=A0A146KJ79_LYGHE
MPTAFAAETSTWRGMATPTVTQYTSDVNVSTPRFGGMANAVGTPSLLFRQLDAFASSGGGGGGMGTSTPIITGTPRQLLGKQSFGVTGVQTPLMNATPMFTGSTPAAGLAFGATPNYQFEGSTPVQSHFASVPETQSATTAAIEAHAKKLERE